MKQPQSGFTLIEMVVVLSILAMMALLVIPKLPDTGDAALQKSARTLAAKIRYIREQAAVTRTPHRLRFFPGEGKIGVSLIPAGADEKPSEDPFLNRATLADGVKVSDIQIPRVGKVSNGELLIDIGPAGLGEITTIHLREPGGGEMTITVFPFGGRVKVDKGYLEATI